MHEQDIIDVLKSARGEVDSPAHRTHLRRALLMRQQQFAPLSHFLTIISMNRYYVSVGSVAAVVAIAMLVAVSPFSSHVASAQEQVQRAYARAIELTPAMRAELESTMKADMLKTLAEAKAAPDLKIMTKEEYEKSGQFTFSTQGGAQNITVQGMTKATAVGATNMQFENAQPVPVGEGGGTVTFTTATASLEPSSIPAGEIHTAIAQGTVVVSGTVGPMATGTFAGTTSANASWSAPVKYLSYTDPEGRKTVLGLDENDTPVFKISTLNEGDVKDMGNGAVGIEGKQIQMLNIEQGTQVKQN